MPGGLRFRGNAQRVVDTREAGVAGTRVGGA